MIKRQLCGSENWAVLLNSETQAIFYGPHAERRADEFIAREDGPAIDVNQLALKLGDRSC